MKKLALLCAVALLLSSVSIGCAANGGWSNWCRTGSLFPTSTTTRAQQPVFMTAASSQFCNPCEPVMCAPCEPAMCAPCEPVCDPCARIGVFSRGVHMMPGPMN